MLIISAILDIFEFTTFVSALLNARQLFNSIVSVNFVLLFYKHLEFTHFRKCSIFVMEYVDSNFILSVVVAGNFLLSYLDNYLQEAGSFDLSLDF
jgi:hypothetical protein